jgi:hypothetical protein
VLIQSIRTTALLYERIQFILVVTTSASQTILLYLALAINLGHILTLLSHSICVGIFGRLVRALGLEFVVDLLSQRVLRWGVLGGAAMFIRRVGISVIRSVIDGILVLDLLQLVMGARGKIFVGTLS